MSLNIATKMKMEIKIIHINIYIYKNMERRNEWHYDTSKNYYR